MVTTGTLSPEHSVLLRDDAEVTCRILVQPYTLPLGHLARQRGVRARTLPGA